MRHTAHRLNVKRVDEFRLGVVVELCESDKARAMCGGFLQDAMIPIRLSLVVHIVQGSDVIARVEH